MAKILRCAVYTRKSTEYGLEQEFNSLEAQREACEAYIKSQAHEGWRLLPGRHDDGGYSGGSLDRPALKQLLDAVRNRQLDIIVVYKVDRLTRSLADFAKLVELFEAHDVSFVSVTQSFNTTSSMGRLTLNVLLSFAQFEREVTGERIRDKIAASKKKGMRMGGPVPLGYETRDKKLVVSDTEAETVRLIFSRYLELGSLRELVIDLRQQGIVTKLSARRDGSTRGGISFTTGALAYLLRNRVYVGEVVHHEKHYPGEHPPILNRILFDAVQEKLDAHASARRVGRFNTESLLAGRIFDDRGNPMLPSSAKKNGARYRYYVSKALLAGKQKMAGSVPRVSAPEIEKLVLGLCSVPGSDQDVADGQVSGPEQQASSDIDGGKEITIRPELLRFVVHRDRLEIVLKPKDESQEPQSIQIPMPRRPRFRRQVICAEGAAPAKPIRAEARARLIEGIAWARHWLEPLLEGRINTAAIAARENCSERAVRMRLNLAFLSPDIVTAAITGTLPDGAGVSRLAEAPLGWEMQRRLVGAPRP